MHWFNPLVYLMAKIIRAEGEAACDAAVVAGDDINKRKQYGEAIIGFIGANNTGRPILSTYFYGGSSDMKKRLISIMDTTRKSRLTAALCAAAVLTLTVLSGTILTNTAFAAAAEAEPSQPYIGEAKAKSIALTHAGITESAATFIRAYLDYDDGRVVYDVEFYSGDTEYDYEIDAESGDIREFDRDIEYYSIPNSSRVTTDAGRYIGEAKAKSIALEAAGIAESGATFIKAYLDSDDGSVVYDVEFYSGNTEYDYEIDAVSGDIREFDEEIEYYSIPRSTSDSSASVTTDNSNYTGGANNHIGKEKAKSIALSDAGLSESRVTRMKVKLDRGHKRTVYEVEFNNGRMEYEYEIDAATGEILESDAEYDD
jgi:uncharacterized membrane protein YkoI